MSGPLDFSFGNMSVVSMDGIGTAAVQMDDRTRLLGTVRLRPTDEGLAVQVTDLHMTIQQGSSTASGTVEASFNVEVEDKGSLRSPVLTFFAKDGFGALTDDLANVPEIAVAVFGVRVTGAPNNSDLGSNRVELTAPKRTDRISCDRRGLPIQIVIVKLGEDGSTYVENADCNINVSDYVCMAVFGERASGFSTFVMAITAEGLENTESVVQPSPTARTDGDSGKFATDLNTSTSSDGRF